MVNRFEDVLARLDAGAVIKPGDRDVIREALETARDGVAFIQLDDCEWLIGSRRYPNWIGYTHIHKLLSRSDEQIHVYELTHQPNLENARKSTQKSVRRAMDTLIASQPDIGEHLQAHITTGTLCTYTGDWDWRVSA